MALTESDFNEVLDLIRDPGTSDGETNGLIADLLERLYDGHDFDPEPEPVAEPEESVVDATPAAVEAAEASGIDLADVEGTGKDGRVTKSDVEDAS